MAHVFARIDTWVTPIPEPVLGLVVLAIAMVFIVATLTDRRRHRDTPTDDESTVDDGIAAPAPAETCHHHPSSV